MPGLVPGISLREALCPSKRDGRDKPGHDKEMDFVIERFDSVPNIATRAPRMET
jgi:hypothetical protein